MQKKKVGITGANGRVGSVLVNGLKDHYDLKLFTYTPPEGNKYKSLPLPKDIEQKSIDLSKEEEVTGVFEGLDVVIHLAAFGKRIDVSPYGVDYAAHRAHNFDATAFVFKECARAKVKRVIFASSNHVHNGINLKNPSDTETFDPSKLNGKLMKETDFVYPDSMYAVAKLFGEELGKLYALHSKLECVAFRIGWLKDADKDDPSDLKGQPSEEYMRAIYLSHRDAIELFKHAIEAEINEPNGIPFIVCYATSDNDRKIFDLTSTIDKLKYKPVDNAEKFFA